MYNTEDRGPEVSPPRRRRHPSRTLANLGIAAGGTGVAYGGYKVGRAVDPLSKKIGSAVEAWTKSAPATAAAKPGKGILKHLLRKFYYQSNGNEIWFQKRYEKGYEPKPGVRSGFYAKKWLAGSEYVGRPEWKGVVEAATRRKAAQLRTGYTKTGKLIPYSTKRPGDFSYPKASELFYPKKWLQAQITANVAGEHTPHLRRVEELRKAQAGQLKMATESGASESVIKALKQAHRKEEKKLTGPYLKALQKQVTPLGISGQRGRFRGAMAESLKERRALIEAYRKKEGTLKKIFPPLPGQAKGETERLTGYRISGRRIIGKEEYTEKMGQLRTHLHGMMETERTKRAEAGAKIESFLRARARKTIPELRKAGGSRTLLPHELEQEVNKVVHPLLHSPVAPEEIPVMQGKALSKLHLAGPTPMPSELESYASRLGFKSGKLPKLYREAYERLVEYPKTAKGAAELRGSILKSPKFWTSLEGEAPPPPVVRTIAKGYPHLKKTGLGLGITAGVLGAGYLAKRLLQKKPAETQFAIPKIPSSLKRRLVAGGALAGGITAADVGVSAKYPEPGETRGQAALAGAKRGALYGTILAGTEYPLTKLLRKIAMSDRSKFIRFQREDDKTRARHPEKKHQFAVKKDDTFGRDVAVGAIEGGAGVLATDRLIRAFAPPGSPLRRKLLIGAGVGGLATGTIGYGLNRLIRRARQDNQNNQMSAKLKEIRFQRYQGEGANAYPRPGRLSVAQHRYKRQIREQEIARHESNLLRSTAAGAALGAIARHKIPLKTAAITGGALGLGTQSALILSDRRKKDIYGAPSITTKRVERLPYQIAGGTAAAVAGRQIYKHLKRFKARGPEICFQIEGKVGRRKRTLEERILLNPQAVAKQATMLGQRGIRLSKDIYQKVRSGKVLDIRGRPKTPEYKKPWVYTLGSVAAIGAVLRGKQLVRTAGGIGRLIKQKAGPVARTVISKVPGAAKAEEFAKQTIAEGQQYVKGTRAWGYGKRILKKLPESPSEKAMIEKAKEAERAKKKSLEQLRRLYEKGYPKGPELQSKLKTIRFAEVVPTWDIRDTRGRSARVYAPGSQKRTRREKYWYERKRSRDILTAILLPTAGLTSAGGAFGVKSWLERRRERKGGPEIKPVKAPGTKIKGVISKEVKAVIPKKGPFKFSLHNKLIEFRTKKQTEEHRRAKWGALAGGIPGAVTGGLTGGYVGALHPEATSAYMGESMRRGISKSIEAMQGEFGESWKPKGYGHQAPFEKGAFTSAEAKARQQFLERKALNKKVLRRIGKFAGIGAATLGSAGALAGYATARAGGKKTQLSSLLDDLIEFKLFIPSEEERKKKVPGKLPFKQGEILDYVEQAHRAKKAGSHTDIRIGDRPRGMYSWATKKQLPESGGKILLHPQPIHPAHYNVFQGEIPEGQYGAGTVTTQHLGKALVTRTDPQQTNVTVLTKRGPHRLAFLKTKLGHLLVREKHPEVGEAHKPKMKTVQPEKAESFLRNVPRGTVVQPKIDGALVFVTTKRGEPEVFSYRTSKHTGKQILHTERFFKGRPRLDIPQERQRTFMGELFGVRRGKTIPPQELGGILNAHIGKSIERQKSHGVDLKIMPFDLAERKGAYPERLAKLRETVAHLPRNKFQLPEVATTSKEALALHHRIKSGRHPLTVEGVVAHPPEGKPVRIKNLEETDVKIHSLFPGKGKYEGSYGGFYYKTKTGKLGKVGTGFSDETRRELPQYIGRYARIRHQGTFGDTGKHRAPALIAIHESKNP